MRLRRWQVKIAATLIVAAIVVYALRWILYPSDSFHDEMLRRERGNLGQMGDAEHLMFLRDRRHLFANHAADLAADIGIDLIKNHQWNLVLLGEGAFHRQHHPRHLATGRDQPQRFGRLARIRGKDKISLLETLQAR